LLKQPPNANFDVSSDSGTSKNPRERVKSALEAVGGEFLAAHRRGRERKKREREPPREKEDAGGEDAG
jgi:hypothetical protein